MFEIRLYNNKSDTNVIDKILENETIFIGNSRQAIDILLPIFIVQGENLNNFNYAYIPKFNRYYYITDIKGLKLNCFEIHFKIDVLKTYSEDIKKSKGLIVKQTVYNPYFGEYETENRISIEKLNFENPFNENGKIILVALRS